MNGARTDVEEALSRATRLAGSEVLRQPRRLRAVLADLVGRAGGDHRIELNAVVAAAEELGDRRATDEEVLAGLRRHGVDDATAHWALATLADQQAVRAGRRGARTRRRTLQIGAALAVLAVPVIAFLVVSGDGGGGSDAAPDTSAPTSSTNPPPATGDFLVTFDDATEGAFLVSRTWEVADGRLVGTVTLTPTTAGGGPAQHRELVPAEAFADPVFTPEPASVTGDVAVFNVDQSSGEPFTIAFEADATTETPDAVAVQSWIDSWRERVVGLRPLDPTPPASASITPQ